jgi:hypothetical protein
MWHLILLLGLFKDPEDLEQTLSALCMMGQLEVLISWASKLQHPDPN